jgi:hypothetical protein
MIRYCIDQATLEAAIDREVPGWLARARSRTVKFNRSRRYNEKAGIWSEVKPIYMRLQQDKCAYCERKLASRDHGGTIDHDLEHFRPKSGVKAWPTPAVKAERGLSFTFRTGGDYLSGYYWLAYHPLNYCAACKKCNTPLKLNYFPIAARRSSSRGEPGALNASEKPLLIYPLGSADEDPEELIEFVGITAVPKRKNGPRKRRADVTIAFFELNRREELLRERAEVLVELDKALALLEGNNPEVRKREARDDIVRLRDAGSRHASCVRCACALYLRDRARTRALFQAARAFLMSLLKKPTP